MTSITPTPVVQIPPTRTELGSTPQARLPAPLAPTAAPATVPVSAMATEALLVIVMSEAGELPAPTSSTAETASPAGTSPQGTRPASIAPGTVLRLQIVVAAGLQKPIEMAAGTVFSAIEVTGPDIGQRTFATPIGLLTLKSDAAAVLPGKVLTLVPSGQAGDADQSPSPIAAQLLKMTGPTRPDSNAAPTNLVLRLVADAIGSPPSARPGTVFPGILMGSDGAGRQQIATPYGLTVVAEGSAAPGRTMLLTPLGSAESRSHAAAPEQAIGVLARLGQQWPNLHRILDHLAATHPEIARSVLKQIPQPGPELLYRLTHFVDALKQGGIEGWLGSDVLGQALAADGSESLASTADDFQRLHQLAEGNRDWQTFLVPLLDSGDLQQLRLFVRDQAGGKEQGEEAPSRFVLEVDLSRIGAMQLEGFARRRHLSLIVRSQRRLPREMDDDIRRIFYDSLEAVGLSGDIRIEPGAAFNMTPRSKLGERATKLAV